MLHSKAYVVAVNMGYGHQRAAFPFLDIAATPEEWNLSEPMIISANSYPGIPEKDLVRWESTRKTYEWISRINSIPVFGKRIFKVMDYFQRIEKFYPRRDLSKPNIQVKEIYHMIGGGFGKHLIDTLNKKPLPLITSFFMTAFFAEAHGYKGEIYCVCTDTDISRAWAPLDPKKSRIIYLAPNKRVRERLKLYGIKAQNIVVTGFPLPKEALGERSSWQAAKSSLSRRIGTLDPRGIYQKTFKQSVTWYLGGSYSDHASTYPLTLTFAVGGAGAQAEIGSQILRSLSPLIKEGKIKLNLIAGTSERIQQRYAEEAESLELKEGEAENFSILYRKDKFDYFKAFNNILTATDILWTKPSELSFYAGLGLPIIMAPTLGSQEECNRAWLHSIGAGMEQDDPRYVDQWLFDWLESGWLAEAAMNGFLHAPKNGTYHAEDLVLRNTKTEIEEMHLI